MGIIALFFALCGGVFGAVVGYSLWKHVGAVILAVCGFAAFGLTGLFVASELKAVSIAAAIGIAGYYVLHSFAERRS